MEEVFPLCQELWGRTFPREAVLLPYVASSSLSLCETAQREVNLKDLSLAEEGYFHANDGALLEARREFASLSLEGIQLIYVYGVGLGYFYEAAATWLSENPSRSLVFFEDDIGVIYHFFHTKRALELLQNPQVTLLYMEERESLKKSLGANCWNFLLQSGLITSLPFYKLKKGSSFEQLQHTIAFESSTTRQLLEEYLHYGAAYFYNCYQNLLFLPQSYLGNGLFGRFKNVPAIICGAGPSLEKNRLLLEQLQQRALIFSGGSATNALNSIGIQPHFAVGIDPNEAQLQRLSTNVAFEVPFFYRSRLNHAAFLKVHAPRAYLTGGEGYGVMDFFEERLRIEGESLEEGRNVITFALEIAYKMGCYPIIFVGMDLAFTSGKSYSAGIPAEDDAPITKGQDETSFPLQRSDIFGRPVTTAWKWIAESEWIADWSKAHPKAILINCTEGGIGFSGIPNKTLATVISEELVHEWDLASWIHAEIQNNRLPQVTSEKVASAIDELKESLVKASEAISTLLAAGEAAKEHCRTTKSIAAQSGMAALAEIELADEPAYEHILAMFNLVYSQYLNPELTRLKQTAKGKEAFEKEILHIDINQKKLQFLLNVAAANLELIQYAQANKTVASATIEHLPLPQLQRGVPVSLPLSTQNGQETTFYPDDKPKCISHYSAGLLHGESTYYSEEGTLLSKGVFHHGKRQGELLWFYPSGKLYSQQNFEDGLKNGQQLYYYENGNLKTSMHYAMGSLTGEIHLYTEDGELQRRIW